MSENFNEIQENETVNEAEKIGLVHNYFIFIKETYPLDFSDPNQEEKLKKILNNDHIYSIIKAIDINERELKSKNDKNLDYIKESTENNKKQLALRILKEFLKKG